jgi:hypothetical protein
MTASYWNVIFPAHPERPYDQFSSIRTAMAFHIDQLMYTNGHTVYHRFLLYEDRSCLLYLLTRLENVKGERRRDKKGRYRVFTKG